MTLLAVLFVTTFGMAYSGEKLSRTDFTQKHNKDFERQPMPQDNRFEEITTHNTKVYSLSRTNPKSDELLGVKFLPIIINISKDDGEQRRITYTYDNMGNKLTELTEILSNNIWEEYEYREYIYDNMGNILTELFTVLSPKIWWASERLTFIYNLNGNLVTRLRELWNQVDKQWENYKRYIYSYDNNGNKLNELLEYWEDEEWKTSNRYTYTYDQNGNVLTEVWNSGINDLLEETTTYTYHQNGNISTKLYENDEGERNSYTFDNNGNILTSIFEMDGRMVDSTSCTYNQSGNILTKFHKKYNWSNYDWTNYRDTYTYDQNGNILIELNEEWWVISWPTKRRYTYTYDPNGKKKSKLSEFWQDNNHWQNHERFTYTYDQNTSQSTEFIEKWIDGTIKQWVNSYLNTYSYDINGDLVSKLCKIWADDQWVNYFRNIYSYDENREKLTDMQDSWSSYHQEWNHGTGVEFTVDLNGNIVSGVSFVQGRLWNKEFSNIPQLIIYGAKFEITWTSIASVDETSDRQFLKISPNPSADVIKIALPEGFSIKELRISNSLGEIVKTIDISTLAGSESIDISTSDLPAGTYYIHTKSGKDIGKFVKE